jgi:hypothetical protein
MHENLFSGSQVDTFERADGQTDVKYDEANSRLSQFCERA